MATIVVDGLKLLLEFLLVLYLLCSLRSLLKLMSTNDVLYCVFCIILYHCIMLANLLLWCAVVSNDTPNLLFVKVFILLSLLHDFYSVSISIPQSIYLVQLKKKAVALYKYNTVFTIATWLPFLDKYVFDRWFIRNIR